MEKPTTSSLAWRVSRAAVQIALFAAVCYYAGKALNAALASVAWSEIHFDPLLMACAVASTIVIILFAASTNHSLLQSMHPAPSWGVVAAATWVSRTGKYLPGKVFSVAGMAYFLRPYGVPATLSATVVVLNTALTVLVGLIVSAPLMLADPVRSLMPLAWLWSAITFAGGAIAVYPAVMIPLLNFALKLTGRPKLAVEPRLAHYGRPFVYILGQWLFTGIAVWCVARSVQSVEVAQIPLFVSASGLAVIAGFLAVFAPGGLGVREGVLLAILSPAVGPGTAAIATITSRLLTLAIELVLAGIGYLFLRFRSAARDK